SGKTEILGLYAQKLNNEAGSSIDDNYSPVLNELSLSQNHPNPFNPSTTIKFSVNHNTPKLELKIYNVKGQLVKNLFSGAISKGTHSLVWDGRDNEGSSVSSGVYFYRLSDGKNSQERKMLLMK
ncbi:MAG: FlgD immunoglobulin-like domain containing protein, partial [Candidatus Cloacimonetes bacterium]|nr:FlgD immunoglobulin-like domain containing protein [Candidatus Cloacimonadota bacterium]